MDDDAIHISEDDDRESRFDTSEQSLLDMWNTRSFVHRCAEISPRSFMFEPELRRDMNMEVVISGVVDTRDRDIIFQGGCVK